MHSCGMHDDAGEWADRVGIPSKRGVNIVREIPGQFGIGIFSPLLDSQEYSVRGILACWELSQPFGLHMFESGFTGTTIRDVLVPTRGG